MEMKYFLQSKFSLHSYNLHNTQNWELYKMQEIL